MSSFACRLTRITDWDVETICVSSCPLFFVEAKIDPSNTLELTAHSTMPALPHIAANRGYLG
jgi:hypothetical protein